MYQALYRKWRPQTFEDVVGQEHITSVLQYQAENGKLSHAYMFCGSRGTGKTTCAKLLAKAANCTDLQNGSPCNKCESCKSINNGTAVDVVELDAASNNRVDDIREICDEVVYPPAMLKKRVYIVDEVHMLTTQAFNALLKTLEEPPEHAMFILATTELQKVPATIMSRCQRFDFSRIKKEKITDRIMKICSAEGINMDREAAEVISDLSDGAMRDALSLLESCSSNADYITAEYVINLLGLSNNEQLLELLISCAKQNTTRAISILNDLYNKNSDLTSCFNELLSVLRDVLVIKNVQSPKQFINCTQSNFDNLMKIADLIDFDTIVYYIEQVEKFTSIADTFGINKKAAAEIAVIKMTSPDFESSAEALAARISDIESKLDSGTVTVQTEKKTVKSIEAQKPKAETQPKTKTRENKDVFPYVNDFIKKFGEKEMFVKFFIESAKIIKKGNTLYICCGEFEAKNVNKPQYIASALDIAKSLDGDIEYVEVAVGEINTDKNINSDLDSL